MCRLPQQSDTIGKLGNHLHRKMIEHGQLSFVMWEQSGHLGPQHMDRQLLPQRVVEKMIREHKFEMDSFVFQVRDKVLPTHINLCFGNLTTFPISGFPRSLLTAEHHNTSPRNSPSALAMPQTGFGVVTRAASRYTHGSRRLERGAAWMPPSKHEVCSMPDLRQYSDSDRIVGSYIVDQSTAAGTRFETSLPEVVLAEQVCQDTVAGTAHIESSLPEEVPAISTPAPSKWPILQQQSQGQPSTRLTRRNAFRALLWPVRAHANHGLSVLSKKGEEDSMSLFVGPPSPRSHDGGLADPDDTEYFTLSTRQLMMQYYHVDSAEYDIYQQWLNLLGPTMGGGWVPVEQPGPPERHKQTTVVHELGPH